MALAGPIPKRAPSVDLVFRAFADRTRLRLLNLISTGETCVCDLVAVLGVPQAKVSRHLAYLRKAGLVRARKDGLWHYYSLAEPTAAFHKKLIECLGCCLSEAPELKRDVARLKRSGCGDGCC
jgi:ArsR family transcriptional regulator